MPSPYRMLHSYTPERSTQTTSHMLTLLKILSNPHFTKLLLVNLKIDPPLVFTPFCALTSAKTLIWEFFHESCIVIRLTITDSPCRNPLILHSITFKCLPSSCISVRKHPNLGGLLPASAINPIRFSPQQQPCSL